MDYRLYIAALVALLIGFLIGSRFGRRVAEAPKAAGFIDFVMTEDGHEQCIFKLKDDVDWIAKQDFIIFQVRKGPNDASP